MATGGYAALEVSLEASRELHHLQLNPNRRAVYGVLPRSLTPVHGEIDWEDLEAASRCQRCQEVVDDL